MNLSWLEKIWLEVAVLTALLLSKALGQDYNYYGGGGGDGYSYGDYQSQNGVAEAGPNTIECYSCHYQLRDGTPEGMASCDDPFDKLDIPFVNCPGPCGKLRHGMTEGNPDDYMVIRNCIPGCKDRSNDEKGNYQECCTEALCNGANGTVTSAMSLTYMTGLLCLVISLLLRT